MPECRRVAITGIGAVTPIAIGRAALWDAVRSGRSAIAPIRRFDASALRSRLAAEITCFDARNYLEGRQARRLDRFASLAVAAGLLALDDAGLSRDAPELRQAAIAVGSALGGLAFAEQQHNGFVRDGIHTVEPTLAQAVFGGAAATNLAILLDARGPTLGNAGSCASGLIALGEAFRLVASGAVELALAGGAEAPLAPLTFGAFSIIRAMSARNDCPEAACRPFDATRDGFVMGEGAAVLVLQPLERALAHGRQPYAEVAGYGLTNDAWHMLAPRPDGSEAARAMRLALAEAGEQPEAVEYVNAHATGTVLGDAAEALAIRTVLDERWPRVPVSGTKPLHGHALGATGAIEAAITALALQQGWLPPTKNLHQPDADCALNHVPPEGLAARPRAALCNAFGFGGINASLLLRRLDEG